MKQYIKSLKIGGFKKFKEFQIEFGDSMNIIIGENEAGKSTILQAIKILISQQYKNVDKSFLLDLFNLDEVQIFENSPCVKNLPSIKLEMELELDASFPQSSRFYGLNRAFEKAKESKYGIFFKCEYDKELGELCNAINYIKQKQIPYEYYSMSWETFGGITYQAIKKPFSVISIDTTSGSATQSFNAYSRNLFQSVCDDEKRAKLKTDFQSKINVASKDIEFPRLIGGRDFCIDSKKLILENLLSILDGGIQIENRGSGMECLIKTELAINKEDHIKGTILMEEPENHLSPSSMHKMISSITRNTNDAQIILTTHSNTIASRLGLKNVIWISGNNATKLINLSEDDAKFFQKADDNSFLQLLLSNKAILVEGATEYILMPKLFKQITEKTIEESEISIISCKGLTYKRYLHVARLAQKKVAVITDNDKSQRKLKEIQLFNSANEMQQIFTSENTDEYTWEVCFYNRNKDELNKIADDISKNDDKLDVLLNNKAETAYKMLESDTKWIVPDYIKKAIEWIAK